MTNHLHLLLASHGADISQVMKSINISYVIYFNRKYERCGHLFQDRFKSELVDSNEYVLEVSRYIHLNPEQAGMVTIDRIHEYPWSSYRQYVQAGVSGPLPVDTEFILGLFSDNPDIRREKYQEYVMRDETADEYKGAGGYGAGFTKVALLQADEPRKDIPLASQEFFKAIAANCGVDWHASREKRSNEVQQRNQMIRETRRQTQMTLKEIGILFGGLSESMISKILKED
jgi:hypothetical protein